MELGIIANIAYNKRNSETHNDHYFDHQLYKERYVIEKTSVWMESFRSILNRFDTTTTSWIRYNYLAFIVIALRKFQKKVEMNSIKEEQ
ncbi:hypothetical protein D1632_05355 [Chryseobacterium nematophagum]|uniref:Transposase DDE domain-containing protein n=1 Tax=Chryseobacterium nematophagum TaxID=2305228 RepID=A0A3M7LFN1_9FLAO|nr:transposase [Chryseobacterium nematophagum]RMZ60366.1 hypothetical protein D1632_05355 [Chryseobacterium nematophagum]